MSDDQTDTPRVPGEVDKDIGSKAPDVRERVKALRAKARMGGWGLVAFVIVSVLAIPDSHLLPALSDSIRRFLGAAPPSNLVSIALIVYAFSALTLTLARIAQGSGTYKGWSHLFYITSFYVFFGFAGTLKETYWAVFVSGLLIMGLENYLVRAYVSEELRREKRETEKKKFKRE